jgi:hypothetical protein
MAAITRLDVRVVTATDAGAGTDGEVYLGIAGREFHLDSAADDFEAGTDRTYTLGEGANILNAARNDPRNPQLDTADLSIAPVWIRFEPGENWHLEGVIATVNPGASQLQFRALAGAPDLWLGPDMGKFCILKRV